MPLILGPTKPAVAGSAYSAAAAPPASKLTKFLRFNVVLTS
jgi:hypothetical protein